MNRVLSLLLLLGVIVLVGGCRLAVIVVEGGEVQSIASGTCIAKSICLIDVDDPNFSETFTAVAQAGWYFQKWNSGDRLFCGNSTEPTCTLSFDGYEEADEVLDMVGSSETFFLMPIFTQIKPIADTITVNGKVWAQVDLFTGVSFRDIYEVCQEEVCSGVLDGYDMTGWRWASIDDMNALFNHYIGSGALGPELDEFQAKDAEAPWATSFFQDGWRSTSSAVQAQNEVRFVDGFLSDYFSFDAVVYSARLVDVIVATGEHPVDSASTRFVADINEAFKGIPTQGAWFYRAN